MGIACNNYKELKVNFIGRPFSYRLIFCNNYKELKDTLEFTVKTKYPKQ